MLLCSVRNVVHVLLLDYLYQKYTPYLDCLIQVNFLGAPSA